MLIYIDDGTSISAQELRDIRHRTKYTILNQRDKVIAWSPGDSVEQLLSDRARLLRLMGEQALPTLLERPAPNGMVRVMSSGVYETQGQAETAIADYERLYPPEDYGTALQAGAQGAGFVVSGSRADSEN